jgi:hypothetical protein
VDDLDRAVSAGDNKARIGKPVNAQVDLSHVPVAAARMLAVEILLAEPEGLGDDVLETCLYILRDRLRAEGG